MIFCAFLCAIANGYDGEFLAMSLQVYLWLSLILGSLMTAIIAVRFF